MLKIVSPDERASKAYSVQNTPQVFNNGKLIITVSWKQISWGIAMTLVRTCSHFPKDSASVKISLMEQVQIAHRIDLTLAAGRIIIHLNICAV